MSPVEPETPPPSGTAVLGREPALWLGAIAAAVQLISYLALPLTPDQQSLINAVATAVFGVIAAFMVSQEKAVPALLGCLQAIIALAIGFGAHLSPGVQTSIMTAAAAFAAFVTRTQVVAPVPLSARREVT